MRSCSRFCHEPAFIKIQRIHAKRKTTAQKEAPFSSQPAHGFGNVLTADAFHPALKTHKLKGNLEGSWACSVAYDLRIVFSFVEESGNEAILLEAVGTHDEVYWAADY